MFEKELQSIAPDQVMPKLLLFNWLKEIWGGCSNIKPLPFGIYAEAACSPVSGTDSFFSEGVPNSPVKHFVDAEDYQ